MTAFTTGEVVNAVMTALTPPPGPGPAPAPAPRSRAAERRGGRGARGAGPVQCGLSAGGCQVRTDLATNPGASW